MTINKLNWDAKTSAQTSALPVTQKLTATELNQLGDTVDEIVEVVNPLAKQTTLTNPLLFDQDRLFVIEVSTDISLTLATSGNSTGFVYNEYIFNGNSTNSINWDILDIDLSGDAFDNTKKNYLIVVWDGESIVSATNKVSELSTPVVIVAPVVNSVTVENATPDELDVVFSSYTGGSVTGLSLGGDLSDATILSIISQTGGNVKYQLSRSLVNGEIGNFVYVGSDIENSGEFLVDGSTSVTNSVLPVDTTLPVITASSVDGLGETTATVNATVNEASGVFYAIYDNTTDRDSATASSIELGTDAIVFNGFSVSANVAGSDSVTGLTASTNYYLRMVAEDTSANVSLFTDIDFVTSSVIIIPNTLGEFLFNGDLLDTSGNNSDGQLVSGSTAAYVDDRDGNPNSALTLVTSSKCTFGASGDFDITATGLTISFWIRDIGGTGSLTYVDYGAVTGNLFIGNHPVSGGTVVISRSGFGATPMIDTGVAIGDHFICLTVTSGLVANVYVDDMTTPTNTNVDISGTNISGLLGSKTLVSGADITLDALYINDKVLTESERVNIKAND